MAHVRICGKNSVAFRSARTEIRDKNQNETGQLQYNGRPCAPRTSSMHVLIGFGPKVGYQICGNVGDPSQLINHFPFVQCESKKVAS